ncbi:MAG TPA: class IV adenylate cyclase [Phycisphaerae bacterium]|nr:class IV adenylate cyclase [Phycisphaerae bacterium]
MEHMNVEIKAACRDPDAIRRLLRARGADCRGTDRQVDTYFRVASGRLKLREGQIENHLIFYRRGDEAGPKRADVLLLETPPGPRTAALKEILTRALGAWVVVDKRREIYFLDHVKVHLDVVEHLGSFLEIEAQSAGGGATEEALRAQCREVLGLFGVRPEELVAESYSDLLAGP